MAANNEQDPDGANQGFEFDGLTFYGGADGGGGDDTFIPGAVDTLIIGGAGEDVVDYSSLDLVEGEGLVITTKTSAGGETPIGQSTGNASTVDGWRLEVLKQVKGADPQVGGAKDALYGVELVKGSKFADELVVTDLPTNGPTSGPISGPASGGTGGGNGGGLVHIDLDGFAQADVITNAEGEPEAGTPPKVFKADYDKVDFSGLVEGVTILNGLVLPDSTYKTGDPGGSDGVAQKNSSKPIQAANSTTSSDLFGQAKLQSKYGRWWAVASFHRSRGHHAYGRR